MKYIKSNTSQNIIKDSDINLSESFNNQKLSDVLVDYRNELNNLKSNVKWLAKYGGVGGSGTGGSNTQNVKLKYKVDVIYHNLNGELVSKENITSGSICEDLLAQPGYITFRITLVKCMQNTPYRVAIIHGNKTDECVLNSSDIHITRQISCDNNQDFIIRVWSIPDDLSEVKIPIYTKFNDVQLNFVCDGANIGNGGLIYEDTKNNTTLVGTIINYLPTKFDAEFTLLFVNGNSVPFTPQQVDDYTIQFQMNASEIVNLFGIYELILNYTYNGVPDLVKQVYIYKDENPFIYCFGKTNTVYSQDQTTPAVSNFSYETVYFTIYPKQGDSSTTIYSDVLCTISYEGLTNEFSTKSNYASYTEYSVSFLNIFSDENFNTSDFKKITITFTIEGINYVYYLFVKKIDDIEYIFKYKYTQGGLNMEELFYNAIHACTAIPGSDAGITTFPETTETTIRILEETTHTINKLADYTSLTQDVKYIYGTAGPGNGNVFTHGYITNYNKQSGGDIPDMLLSFGLKYLELNTDLPIVSIQINNSNRITLYSNKIKYNDQEYTRWCIPNDDQYHLVLLYYKPCYTITGLNYTHTAPENEKAAFIFCIDGIFETSPIILNERLGFSTQSSVTYHPGNWEFNLLGIASFNAKPTPNDWKDKGYNKLVLKYILDFDPIIPANYYLAYYQYTNGSSLQLVIDKSIYQLLYSNDSNNQYGINYYKECNKFIPVDIKTISSLSTLPIYVISPINDENQGKINNFLYNTYAGKYGEGSLPEPTFCQFKKAEIRDGLLSLYEMVSDSKYMFLAQYLGSSTLKFGAKNFEISAVPYSDVGEEPKNIVWTPDANVFLPESSFVLKADIVDSSHSNNVVVGKFINEYMSEFSFSDGSSDQIKTCLEGFPILLFMEDVTTDGVSNMVFLGIYSFNLGRNSVFNLGYKQIDLSSCEDISNSNIESSRAYLVNNNAITYPYNYRVAEVLGNSHLLYDYSLYDTFVLKDMLGDFYNYDGSSENNSYSDSFGKPFLGLCKLIRQVFIGNLDNFDPYNFSNNELFGYYRPKTNLGLFNVLLLNFNCKDDNYVTQVLDSYYYAVKEGDYKPVPLQSLVLTLRAIEYIMPYCIATDNGLTVINNPFYRFHRICYDDGLALDDKLYYVEKLDSLPTFSMESDDCFDYDNILKYYMVCMIFAMVDSVLKNLTMRCKNYSNNNPNTWLAGFYDMDTSFGLNNSGGISDFKAFSDFITDDGDIISDYFQMNSSNTEGSGFDSPSSFLFLVAKYLNILIPDMEELDVPILSRIFKNNESTDVLRTPYNYWYELRKNQLTSADHFFSTYVDGHFQNVHPLIWNLNYLYKYFSASSVEDGDTETEQSKFHGTRRFSRKQWFELRLGILDVLFGIRNNHKVGNSSANYICKLTANQTAQSQQEYKFNILGIPISQSMFPQFSKGVEGININANVTIYPKAPIVLLTSVSDYKLYIADSSGKINNIRGTIGSNVDVGFYGTRPIRELSEFGQFLTASSAGGITIDNTIVNLFITSINIDYGLDNASLRIKLNLDDTKSVKTIFVNNSGSKNKIYKCNTININSNSLFVLENLTIKYSKLTDLILGNDNPQNTIRIKNLTLEENNITNLTFKNVIVENLTISNCSITSYNLNGDFPNLNINDSVTTSFVLYCSSSNGIDVTLNTQSLQTLTLKGHINKFTNKVEARSCSEIIINELISNSITLNLDNFTGYLGEILIGVNSNTILCDDIYISGQNNLKCTQYHIKGNVGNIHLLPSAFSKNKSLTALLLNENRIIENKPFIIHGDCIFEYCDKLPIDLIVKDSDSEKLQIDNGVKSCKYLFRKCTQLKIADAINIITNLTGGPNRLNLSGMFIGCSGIELEPELVSGKYKISDDYKTLLALLENADITNGKGDLVTICDNFFTGTGIKLIEENLVHFFTYKDKGKYILPNIISGTTEIYMTSNALSPWQNFNGELVEINSVSLGKHIWDDNTAYTASPIKILEKILGLDDLYEVMTNVNLYDLLGGDNSKIETIDGLHLYANADICIDCTDGLPATVKSLKYFCCKVADFNFKNLLNLFNNVGDDCLVFMDTFFGLLTLKNSKLLSVDLYQLLFKDDELPKVVMKLLLKCSSTNLSSINRHYDDGRSCMNFPKICTLDSFKKIMDYLMTLQDRYLTTGNKPGCDLYDQIPGLFLNCLITNVASFNTLISIEGSNNTYFDSKTNEARTVSFIDLDMTFKNCILLNGGLRVYFKPRDMWTVPTLVFILRETFMNTDQEMLLGPYDINSVIDMLKCFYDCKYNITLPTSIPYVPTNRAFEVTWNWYNDFQIIPSKFFDICSNSANINNCFSASEIRSTNLLGQLPQNSELMWWTNLSPTGGVDICTNALIYPMWGTSDQKGNNFYIYPIYYTTLFKLYPDVYKHVVLPLETNEDKWLYIFETTDGVVLNSKLPKLPGDREHGPNYTSFLEKNASYKVHLNPEDMLVGFNMNSKDYQRLLYRSLFYVLFDLKLPVGVSSILKPLIENDYDYKDPVTLVPKTPGGIVIDDLDDIVENAL